MTNIIKNIKNVEQKIAHFAEQVERNAEHIQLLAVSN